MHEWVQVIITYVLMNLFPIICHYYNKYYLLSNTTIDIDKIKIQIKIRQNIFSYILSNII